MIHVQELKKYRQKNTHAAIPCKQGLALGAKLGAVSKVQLALFLMELRDNKND